MARWEYELLDKALLNVQQLEAQGGDYNSIADEMMGLFKDVPSDCRFYVNDPYMITVLQLLNSFTTWKGSVLLEDPTDELKTSALEIFGASKVFVLSGTHLKCLDESIPDESIPELTDSNASKISDLVEKSCDQVLKKISDLVDKRCDQLMEGLIEHNRRNERMLKNLENLIANMKRTVSNFSEDKNQVLANIVESMRNLAPEIRQHSIDTQIRGLTDLVRPLVLADDPDLTISKQLELALKTPLEKIKQLRNQLNTETLNKELVKHCSDIAALCHKTHESLEKKISDLISSLDNMDGKQEQCKHEAEVTRCSMLAVEYGKQQEQCKHEAEVTRCSMLAVEYGKQQVEMHRELEKIISTFSSVLNCNQDALCSFQKEFSDLKSSLTFDTFSEISTLISQKEYEKAFMDVLLRHDGVMLSRICSEVNLEQLLYTTTLSHETLLGLLVQLSDNLSPEPDLTNDTQTLFQTMLTWMTAIAYSMPREGIERDRCDLEKVHEKVDKIRKEHGNSLRASTNNKLTILIRVLPHFLNN